MMSEEDRLGLDRHWTYRELPCDADLGQGDVVLKTPDLADAIAKKHSRELEKDTTHVIVLTQSCDLVRPKSEACKTPVILVAPVRPIWRVIEDRLGEYQSKVEEYAGICRQSKKGDLRLFLERLLNNNVEDY
ncbi:MAG: hypothetical protein V2B18_24425, partial [Pseudomonadota bacterium]